MMLEDYEALKDSAQATYDLLRKMVPRLPEKEIKGLTPDVAITHERIANVVVSRVRITLIMEDDVVE